MTKRVVTVYQYHLSNISGEGFVLEKQEFRATETPKQLKVAESGKYFWGYAQILSKNALDCITRSSNGGHFRYYSLESCDEKAKEQLIIANKQELEKNIRGLKRKIDRQEERLSQLSEFANES